jgi:hypothetical protein
MQPGAVQAIKTPKVNNELLFYFYKRSSLPGVVVVV